MKTEDTFGKPGCGLMHNAYGNVKSSSKSSGHVTGGCVDPNCEPLTDYEKSHPNHRFREDEVDLCRFCQFEAYQVEVAWGR